MDFETVNSHLMNLPNTTVGHPFDDNVAVYYVSAAGQEPQMFALVDEKRTPLRVSLKCDPKLSALLREKYETVMPGDHLNKKYWNTVLLTGQLEWEEVVGLITLSYNLVSGATI